MNCSHSVRWALGAVLFSAVLSFPASAEHRDPAPIAEEAVQKVLDGLRANPPHPLPEMLRHHLDETQEIVRQMERDEAGGITEDERMTCFENRRALLASKLHELEMTRSELRAQFAQTRAKLVSLKLNEKVKAWDALQAKVEQRFDRMKRALDGVHRSHGKAERSASMAEVKSILRDSHESVKNREAVPAPIRSRRSGLYSPRLSNPAVLGTRMYRPLNIYLARVPRTTSMRFWATRCSWRLYPILRRRKRAPASTTPPIWRRIRKSSSRRRLRLWRNNSNIPR